MRHALLLATLALFAAAVSRAVDVTELPTPELQARYLELTHELRCMQCQNQSLADSPVDLASDLRREVKELLIAGKSDDEVRAFMVARYGEFILFRPAMSLRNAWLWLAPGVLLLLGIGVAARIMYKRSQMLAQDDEPVEEEVSR